MLTLLTIDNNHILYKIFHKFYVIHNHISDEDNTPLTPLMSFVKKRLPGKFSCLGKKRFFLGGVWKKNVEFEGVSLILASYFCPR